MPLGMILGALIRGVLRSRRDAQEDHIVVSLEAFGIPVQTYAEIKHLFTSRICQGTWAAKERGIQMVFVPENGIVDFVDKLLRAMIAEIPRPSESTRRMPSDAYHKGMDIFSTFTRKIGWSEINEFAFRIRPDEASVLLNGVLTRLGQAFGYEMVPIWNEEVGGLVYSCSRCGVLIPNDVQTCPQNCFEIK
jgi:hypothetical protein